MIQKDARRRQVNQSVQRAWQSLEWAEGSSGVLAGPCLGVAGHLNQQMFLASEFAGSRQSSCSAATWSWWQINRKSKSKSTWSQFVPASTNYADSALIFSVQAAADPVSVPGVRAKAAPQPTKLPDRRWHWPRSQRDWCVKL